MQGQFIENHKVVDAIPCTSAATSATCDIVSLENWDHATWIWSYGATATSTQTVLVQKLSDSNSGNPTAIAFRYASTTGTGDTWSASASATTTGFVVSSASVGANFAVEIDAVALGAYSFARLDLTEAADSSSDIHALCILSKGRYLGSGTLMPSVLA